tara:strand:+ start:51021 stop:51437 length:417 start_codon:yes stop_codon:yes gene_type:complete
MEFSFIENSQTHFAEWQKLEKWINQTIESEGKITGYLSFVFMSDEELLGYNKQFLNHDYFTDVITFDNSNYPKISGDILISIDRIQDNAKILEIKYLEEFLRVTIHGVLHLLGYKDKKEEDIAQMRSKEQFYLNQYEF